MATLEHFRSELNDLPWVTDNLEEIVTKCIAEANKDEEAPKLVTGARSAGMECSKKPMKFIFCTYREFNNKCPVEHQKDTKMCKMVREGKLEYIPHSHHHHHHD